MTGFRQLAVERETTEDADHYVSEAAEPDVPRKRNKSEAKETSLAKLVQTIESEIIPRLMLSHNIPAKQLPFKLSIDNYNGQTSVAEFTLLVLAKDVSAASSRVDSMINEGVKLDAIFLDLFAPTARHLGELWEADVCDFTEVTIGLSHLQQLMRRLSAAFEGDVVEPLHHRRALLVPAPGEQHSFGLHIVEQFFHKAGWDVWGEPLANRDAILDLVRREWFAVIGLSLSCEAALGTLKDDIRLIRSASRNGKVVILVGGAYFMMNPEMVAQIGADGTGLDARDAVDRAEALANPSVLTMHVTSKSGRNHSS